MCLDRCKTAFFWLRSVIHTDLLPHSSATRVLVDKEIVVLPDFHKLCVLLVNGVCVSSGPVAYLVPRPNAVVTMLETTGLRRPKVIQDVRVALAIMLVPLSGMIQHLAHPRLKQNAKILEFCTRGRTSVLCSCTKYH